MDHDWYEFVSAIREIGGIEHRDVDAADRIVEDLGLDSLEVTELMVMLSERGVDHTALAARHWLGVSVGELFELVPRGS